MELEILETHKKYKIVLKELHDVIKEKRRKEDEINWYFTQRHYNIGYFVSQNPNLLFIILKNS